MEGPQVGASIEVTQRFTQAEFDEFARLSGDDNPIHVDPVFSARTRFGRTVAHGMLLFGRVSATSSRWLGGPVRVLDQRLTFTAPTFTEEDVTLRLEVLERHDTLLVVGQRIIRADGETTAVGQTVLGPGFSPHQQEVPPGADSAASFKGLRLGMSAASERTFTAAEVDAYRALVDDPNPAFVGPGAEVPPALIGGTISCLLGVDLPGPGTNWLKQHYRFLRPVPVGDSVWARVEISRLRPDKSLVDLANRIESSSGVCADGESLVLAADVAER